jgi:hypothetical protein
MVAREQLVILKKELDAALSQLAVEIAPLDDAQPPQVKKLDAQAARELLEKIQPMLKMGNPECRGFVDSLRGISGSGKLIRQIEDFEFESALSELDDLKNKLE